MYYNYITCNLCIQSNLNTPPSCEADIEGGRTHGTRETSERDSDTSRAIPVRINIMSVLSHL